MAVLPAKQLHIDHGSYYHADSMLYHGMLGFLSCYIMVALRNRKFFSMQEIRDAVKEKLEELSEYPFKGREGNRNTAYLEEK